MLKYLHNYARTDSLGGNISIICCWLGIIIFCCLTMISTNVIQLGLARVLISHDCSVNPTEGYAVINEVAISAGDQGSMPVVATALMAFDSSCNGTVQVVLATGNYVAATGKSIPMNLNRP